MSKIRTPTALKLIAGTDRPSRRNVREPTPALVERRRPPAHLTPEAAAAWRRMLPLLAGMGVLSVADMVLFERLCATAGDLTRLDAALAALGSPVYESKGTDGQFMRRAHPEVAMRSDAERRFMAQLAHFGMSPATRGKVSAAPVNKADPAARFFK